MRRLAVVLSFVIVAGASFAGGWFARPPVTVTETVTKTVTETVEVERKVPWHEPMLFGPEDFKAKFTEAMEWLKEVEPDTYWHFAESIDQIVYVPGEWGKVVLDTRTIIADEDTFASDIEAIAGFFVHETVHMDQHRRLMETGGTMTREQQETEAALAEIEFYRRTGVDWAIPFIEEALASRWWENAN